MHLSFVCGFARRRSGIYNSCHTITLRFPVKPSYENVSERSLVHIEKNIEEEKIDALFHKSSQKRNSSRPVVIMVDSNEEFRSYLETCWRASAGTALAILRY